jgi:acyl-CoA thioester hydrolase
MRPVAELRVRYGDTDMMGIVYYANYLRYFEIARVEYLRLLGRDYRAIEREGIAMAVTEATCVYHLPARFDDLLTLHCRVSDLRRATLTFRYEIRRQPDADLVTRGHTVHACLDRATFRPTRIPEDIRQAVEAFEAAS